MKEKTASKLLGMSFEAYGDTETLNKIAGIICYEAGDVLRDTVRMEDYPDMAITYLNLLKSSLGDVLAMTQLLCSMLKLDFEDVYVTGMERAIERCKEKLDGKDGF